jgi:orotate phosphoribosyltransferase
MTQSVAQALLEIAAVKFTPRQPITFKSGIVSPVYVDNRRLPFHPAQWQTIITGFQAYITQNNLQYDVIAGVAVGGVPHSSALAYALQKPSVFVRKAAKAHGTGQRVEGGSVTDKTVLLIEDLVTTGRSSLDGVHALRQGGATVTDVLAIVSYGFDAAQQNFSDAAVNLHTLTDFDTLLNEALAQNLFDNQDAAVIRDWFADPHNWQKRHNLS